MKISEILIALGGLIAIVSVGFIVMNKDCCACGSGPGCCPCPNDEYYDD